MKSSLTIQISEGLGNQIFMYAFAYALSKSFGYNLYIDNQSGYTRQKNLLRNHQKYMLDNFNIEGTIAFNNMIYNTSLKRLKKKFLLLVDFFSKNKKFLIENKTMIDNKKVAETLIEFNKLKISDRLYVQGNFENELYFSKYKSDLRKIFTPKQNLIDEKDSIINKIKNSNSISLHIRRNRFSDQDKLKTTKNINKSENFTNEIINYINTSVDFVNSKIVNPEYFIWTNDHYNISAVLDKIKINNYTLINKDVINDFNLFKYCKHFIVGPSSFHWWGAWLNENPNKLIIRPSNLNPSNNKNFWPKDWISI